MSMRSPRSSWTTFCTREPLRPTQAPTGSTSDSIEETAIFARNPGSRAAPMILTMPSAISGTSISNSLMRNSLQVRLRISWASRKRPASRASRRTSCR